MKEPYPFPPRDTRRAEKPQEQPRRPISQVFQGIVANIQEILRSEVALARAEIREDVSRATRSAAYLGTGAVLGLFGLGFLLLAAVYALSLFIPAWAAAGAVGLVLAAVAAVALALGRARLRQIKVKPEETIDSMKENVRWARKRTR